MNETSKNKWIAVTVSIAVVGLFFGGLLFYQNNQRVNTALENARGANQANVIEAAGLTAPADLPSGLAPTINSTSKPMNANNTTTTPEGLVITEVALGNGAVAKAGDTIAVHYSGTLLDGTKFDSSYDRGQPLVFQLGVGQVIKGWDQGVEGMRVGGKRKLVIPAPLAYGATGAGNVIPPYATLAFDVELVGIK